MFVVYHKCQIISDLCSVIRCTNKILSSSHLFFSGDDLDGAMKPTHKLLFILCPMLVLVFIYYSSEKLQMYVWGQKPRKLHLLSDKLWGFFLIYFINHGICFYCQVLSEICLFCFVPLFCAGLVLFFISFRKSWLKLKLKVSTY